MLPIAVLLAGCGRMDGSEIHESVLTLLAIKLAPANYQCFSLDASQDHVTNHASNQPMPESRNMLVESARIARGEIKRLEELDPAQYSALIIPGGNGVAYNLFSYAQHGANFTVNSLVSQKCREFTAQQKPIGFICIAPVMIPAIYDFPVHLTIGNDAVTAQVIADKGGIHQTCQVDEICVDEQAKIVTTPAYMLAQSIEQAYAGITRLVTKVVELARA